MDSPAAVITQLKKSGLTEQAIVDQLAALGIQSAQSTINRIEGGKIKRPKFDLAVALVKLRDQVKRSKAVATA